MVVFITVLLVIVALILVTMIALGFRRVRPNRRAIIERFGKYRRIQSQGLTWIFPIVDKFYPINITEMMVNAGKQEVITEDNLNAMVDVQIYFKVKDTPEAIKSSQYAVNEFMTQIVALAQTTLRNVIGTRPFKDVNNKRDQLNTQILETISKETTAWGIEIVRCELKEIDPPKHVQEAMNTVIIAENTKRAASDFAEAEKIKASGAKMAEIQKAEGEKQATILRAEGQSEAIMKVADARAREIEIVNSAAKRYFEGNAVKLKELEVLQASLQNNSKIIISKDGISPILLLQEALNASKKEVGEGETQKMENSDVKK